MTQTTASVAGTVNTAGAPALVHFDFGTTAAYGTSTATQLLAPAAGVASQVGAALTGLPAGSVIHYRIVSQTDFATVDGADATFTTTVATPPPPPVTVTVGLPSATHASISGLAKHKVKLAFTVASGANAPALQKIAVSLPAGLAFTHKTKALTKGVTVTSGGKRLKVHLGLSHGTLTIGLRSPATGVSVTIGASALTVTSKLVRQVKQHKVKHLTVVVKLTDTSNKTTRVSLRLKV